MRKLKAQIQHYLMRAGFYHRLRTSFIYDLYWWFADRKLIDRRSKEINFYRGLLNGFQNGGLVFDIGANHGTKTEIFLKMGAKVVAVEPDDANQQILREAFLRYRMRPRPVTVVGKAVSDEAGATTMWIDEPGSAKNTLSPKWVETLKDDPERFGYSLQFGEKKQVETTTLDQLMERYGVPFFVKIDVEGHELSVLRGLLHPVPYLSFEVNLPEFLDEGLQCVERLRDLAADGRFNYTVDCEQGVALKQWLDCTEFSRAFAECTEKSIEVLWESAPKRP
jgi:FkbM family methyltransferase